MKLFLPVLLALLLPLFGNAQPDLREMGVMTTLHQLFEGIKNGDSAAVRQVFHPAARILTTYTSSDDRPGLATQSVDEFVAAVGTPHEEVWNEKLWSYDIRMDDNLATAWTDYTFFRGAGLSHCGVNAFQLFRTQTGWRIIQVADTRRRGDCQMTPSDNQIAISRLLDEWHAAAASANGDVFFGNMTVDGVYLGTDPGENWRRDELKEWSKPYFEKDSAWAFTPKERHIYLSKDGRYAWFDELLDTQMGTCRGTGVLEKTHAGWKIKHYGLSIAVPNDLVNEYLELLKREQDGN